ncbi:hypothetical protein [Ketobacter sp. GenoA1]|uniref:hypothetical protein n=1 Tax=Ketobacter sp. GenoA1 TaxID=2072747 RepID=UPI0025C71C20|nr:hypothetical protein [Ketobacter sp. GenoA1]
MKIVINRAFLVSNASFVALPWLFSVNQSVRFIAEDFVSSVFWYEGSNSLYFYIAAGSVLISFSFLQATRIVDFIIILVSALLLTGMFVQQAIALLYEPFVFGLNFVGALISVILSVLIVFNLYRILEREVLIVGCSLAGSLSFSVTVIFHLLDSIPRN